MKKSILLTVILLLTKQFSFCETTSKPGPVKNDSCFNRAELQVINGVFIDLDDCELKDSINTAIIRKQDSIISSKGEVVEELKTLRTKQDKLAESLYQFTQFQADLSKQQKKENDKLKNQIKWQGIKIAVPTGTAIGLGMVFLLLKVFKVF